MGKVTILACLDMYVDAEIANEEDPEMAMVSVLQAADRQSATPTRIFDIAWGVLGQMQEKVSSTEIVEPPPPPAKGKKGEPVEPPKGPSLEDALPKVLQACTEALREAGLSGEKTSFGLGIVFDADSAWDESSSTYDAPAAVENGLSPEELFEFWERCVNVVGDSLWLLAWPFHDGDKPSAVKFSNAHPSITVAVHPEPDGDVIAGVVGAGVAVPSWSCLCTYETDPIYKMITMPDDPEVFQLLAQHGTSCPAFVACQEGRRFLQIWNTIPEESVSAFGRNIGYHFENQWRQSKCPNAVASL